MATKIIVLRLIFLILIPGFLSAGQSIEELEKKLETVSGKERIEVLNQLAYAYRNISVDKVFKYGKKALILAGSIKDLRGEATALNYLGIGYEVAGDIEQALKNARESLEIFERLGDKSDIGGALSLLGNIYYHSGNNEKALDYFQRSLKIKEELGNKKEIASILGNIGVIYKQMGITDKDLEYQLRALDIREEIGDERGVAISLHNIAYTYRLQRDFDKALDCFFRALEIHKKLGNRSGIAMALESIGTTYSLLKDYAKGLEYSQESLRIKEEIGDKLGICASLANIGENHLNLENYEKSLEYFLKALQLAEEIGHKIYIPNLLINIGLVYLKLKDYDNALRYFKKSEKVMRDNGKEPHSGYYINLHEVYLAMGDYKKALEYYKQGTQKKSREFNDAKSKNLTEIQIKYETLKKEKEIETLKKDNRIQQLLLDRQTIIRNVTVIISVLLLIIFFQFFRRYRYLFTFWKKKNFIAHYKLVDKIGSGGMGDIFKARDIRDKSRTPSCAIKVLKDEYYKDEKYKTRFKNEAALIDQLNHPNIVKVLERGEFEGTLYIAMELLEGETLADLLEKEKQIDLQTALSMMNQMASAIVEIHKRGIIHRDLKPENIMVTQSESRLPHVKILDFGLARTQNLTRLTKTGMIMGTIFYISPEQLTRSRIFPASDIYSLGVIYYQVLTGEKPFAGDTAVDIARQILKREPNKIESFRSDIPVNLNTLVIRMMAKDPEKRPSANEVFHTLSQLIVA